MSRQHGRKVVMVTPKVTTKVDALDGIGRVAKQVRRLRRLERWLRQDGVVGAHAAVAFDHGRCGADGRTWGLWYTVHGPSMADVEPTAEQRAALARYEAFKAARGIRVGDDRLGNMIAVDGGFVLIDCGAIRKKEVGSD